MLSDHIQIHLWIPHPPPPQKKKEKKWNKWGPQFLEKQSDKQNEKKVIIFCWGWGVGGGREGEPFVNGKKKIGANYLLGGGGTCSFCPPPPGSANTQNVLGILCSDWRFSTCLGLYIMTSCVLYVCGWNSHWATNFFVKENFNKK